MVATRELLSTKNDLTTTLLLRTTNVGEILGRSRNKANELKRLLRKFSTRLVLISKIERPLSRNIRDWLDTDSWSIRRTRRHKYRYGSGRMDNYYHAVTVSIIN